MMNGVLDFVFPISVLTIKQLYLQPKDLGRMVSYSAYLAKSMVTLVTNKR